MPSDRVTLNLQTCIAYLFPFALFSGITGVDLLYALLLVTWLVDLYWIRRRIRVIDRIVVSVFVFFLLGLIPNLVNFGWVPLDEFVVHHFRKVLLLLVLIDVLGRNIHVGRVVDLWILSAALAAALSFVGFYTRGQYMGEFVREAGWIQYRAAGPGYWKPNMFANMLACVLPFALFRTVFGLKRVSISKKTLMTFLYLTGTALILTGIVITFTRMVIFSSTLALLAAVAVLLMSSEDTRITDDWDSLVIGIVITGAVAGALWYVGASEFGQERLLRLYEVITHPKESHLFAFWTAAVPHLWERPTWFLFGAGTDQGMEALRGSLHQSLWMLEHRSHAHNNFVQYLLDYGLVGVLGYLILWGTILYQLVRGKFAHSSRWVQWAGITLVFVFNLDGMSEYNWGRSLSHYNVIFGLALALHFSESEIKQDPSV